MTTESKGGATSERAAGYERRHQIDVTAMPEPLKQAFGSLFAATFSGEVSVELKNMVFTVSSMAAGCRHCQAHGAYGLSILGSPNDRIRALWDFESSPLFTEAERVALRFSLAAGVVPNAVTPDLRTC